MRSLESAKNVVGALGELLCRIKLFVVETTGVFGLRNELVHHLLTPHYFCLVYGVE
jgi:hypothetical protein